MTEREDFIATLQACFFGDKNAFEKVLRIYDEKENRINKTIEYVEKNIGLNRNEMELVKNKLLEILRGDNNEC